MSHVRICLSCGTAWNEGTLAYVDGFCLRCPGELGPAVEASAGARAAAAAAAGAAASAVGAATPPTPRPTPTAGGAAGPAAARAASASRAIAAKDDDDVETEVEIEPDLPEVDTTTRLMWGEELTTTQSVAVHAADDLEPHRLRTRSEALTQIRIEPQELAAQQRATAKVQDENPTGTGLDLRTGAATSIQDGSTGPAAARRNPVATRPPSTGSGDTTAAMAPVEIPVPAVPLPARLAGVSWSCRDCGTVFRPGAPSIATKHCGECTGKLQPALALVPPGAAALILYDPDTKVRIGRFALTRDIFLIGRLDPSGGTFPELSAEEWLGAEDARQVSRRHCEIQRDRNTVPETFYLVPLAGNSGVFVKGQGVEPGTRLVLEDRAVIGLGGDRVFLRFEAATAAAPE
ncbi:MAG: FHA domain-containing protein [Planctomycetota bacterium]